MLPTAIPYLNRRLPDRALEDEDPLSDKTNTFSRPEPEENETANNRILANYSSFSVSGPVRSSRHEDDTKRAWAADQNGNDEDGQPTKTRRLFAQGDLEVRRKSVPCGTKHINVVLKLSRSCCAKRRQHMTVIIPQTPETARGRSIYEALRRQQAAAISV